MQDNRHRLTDMELTLYIVRLLNGRPITGLENSKKIYIEYARKIIKTLSNPFAIKMLEKEIDKIELNK